MIYYAIVLALNSSEGVTPGSAGILYRTYEEALEALVGEATTQVEEIYEDIYGRGNIYTYIEEEKGRVTIRGCKEGEPNFEVKLLIVPEKLKSKEDK